MCKHDFWKATDNATFVADLILLISKSIEIVVLQTNIGDVTALRSAQQCKSLLCDMMMIIVQSITLLNRFTPPPGAPTPRPAVRNGCCFIIFPVTERAEWRCSVLSDLNLQRHVKFYASARAWQHALLVVLYVTFSETWRWKIRKECNTQEGKEIYSGIAALRQNQEHVHTCAVIQRNTFWKRQGFQTHGCPSRGRQGRQCPHLNFYIDDVIYCVYTKTLKFCSP